MTKIKILLDFQIQTDALNTTRTNKLELEQRNVRITDIAILGDIRIEAKELETLTKSIKFTRYYKQMKFQK